MSSQNLAEGREFLKKGKSIDDISYIYRNVCQVKAIAYLKHLCIFLKKKSCFDNGRLQSQFSFNMTSAILGNLPKTT